MRNYLIMGIVFFAAMTGMHSKAMAQTVVLELFTSQGCSSCPPADDLMKRLSAEDPALLPLSMHVHYWDYLGWKDPYSSPGNTGRQRGYAAALGDPQIFTPQLIVNGGQSVLGSDEASVRTAIVRAKQTAPEVDIAIGPNFSVTFDARNEPPENADIWAIAFDRYARTAVNAGENGGRILENINNVTAVTHVGVWPGANKHFAIPLPDRPNDSAAIIVQRPNEGPILGAAVYYGSAK